jgi:hypothetical protein
MPEYIDVPIETDPEVLAEEAFEYLQSQFPGWAPADANLETILVEAISSMASEVRDVASLVPTSIFRYFGSLVDVPPNEATFATGKSTWTAINTLGYTIEAGTQVGFRKSGDELIVFEVAADVSIPPGSSITAVGEVELRAIEPGADASGLGALGADLELVDALDWVSLVELSEATTGGEDAEEDLDYLDRLSGRLRLMAPRLILPLDYSLEARETIGVWRAIALDGYRADHNMATVNQSNVETDTTGFQVDTNSTISRVTSQQAEGVASLQIASAAAGDFAARTLSGASAIAGILPNTDYTALASIKPNINNRVCSVRIHWYTIGGSFLSTSVGVETALSNASFTQLSVTGRSPATAGRAAIVVYIKAAAGAAENAWADKWSLHEGYSLTWAIGGTNANSNERVVSVAAIDTLGENIGPTVKTALDAALQAKRELTFLAFVIDPQYTYIDVNFLAQAVPGFDKPTVDAAAEAAVRDYLSPANWGKVIPGDDRDLVKRQTVRFGELYQVINAVDGIDFVLLLQLAIQGQSLDVIDISLGGSIPIPRPGTITGTVQ